MSKKHKILTVSYGAFSCTLDGFDDPIRAMREVAEFFKTLAAEDRFFGAESFAPESEALRPFTGTARPAGDPENLAPGSIVVSPHPTADPGSTMTPSGPANRVPHRAETEEPARRDPRTASDETQDEEPDTASAFFARATLASRPDDTEEEAEPVFALTTGSDKTSGKAPATGGVAERLQRIRAVAARQERTSAAHPPAMPTGADVEGVGARTPESLAGDLSVVLKRIDAEEVQRTGARDGDPRAPAERSSDAVQIDPPSKPANGDDRREAAAELDSQPGPGAFGFATGAPADQATVAVRHDPAIHLTGMFSAGDPTLPDALPILPQIGDEEEVDLSRLMVEAEHQMAEPEATTRRNAFAHLRAAVAARFADNSIAKASHDETEQTERVFRDDLAEAVIPGPPLAREDNDPARHSGERPSLLRLVAAQRVDLPPVGKTSAKRPPLPEHRQPAGKTGAADFATFAKGLDTSDLVGLVEAAAGYLSRVEGRDSFSRTQVLECLRSLTGAPFRREECLRCFGQSLRAGRIIACEDGRFSLQEDIPAKPGSRVAG